MGTAERLLATSLLLVFVYLVLSRSSGATSVIGALGTQLAGIFKVLQGR